MSKMLILLLAPFPKLARHFIFVGVLSWCASLWSYSSCWGQLQVQFSSILGLFESRFACLHLFHKIPRAIYDEVKQAFRLPLDWIVRDPMDELAWFNFLLLPRWCLHYIRRGHSSQHFCLPQEVYGKWLVFPPKKVFTCFTCAPFSSLMGRFFDHSFSPMSNFKES